MNRAKTITLAGAALAGLALAGCGPAPVTQEEVAMSAARHLAATVDECVTDVHGILGVDTTNTAARAAAVFGCQQTSCADLSRASNTLGVMRDARQARIAQDILAHRWNTARCNEAVQLTADGQ